MVHGIAATAEEQSAPIIEATSSVTMLSAIYEESSMTIEYTLASVEGLTTSMQELRTATQDLIGLSENSKSATSRFKLKPSEE
ncbi:MAG: hypothetical protein KAH86_00665 [Methanosarcinales archaeon]|nr:hypothetical protein [Methanosarcinales archaeon]